MASTGLGNFTKQIEKILDEYQKDVSESLERGLDEAQIYLIGVLKRASPVGESNDHYAGHWKKGDDNHQGFRTVKNDKKVPMSRNTYLNVAHDSHLAGILEYSTNHSVPHIEATRRKARPKIMKILKESIKNGA